jgi:hypothetical protein
MTTDSVGKFSKLIKNVGPVFWKEGALVDFIAELRVHCGYLGT